MVNAPSQQTAWCFSFGAGWRAWSGAPASEGLAVEARNEWCPICHQPDDDTVWCRCDYPTQAQLIELLRTIYADESTPEKIKTLIEDAFR